MIKKIILIITVTMSFASIVEAHGVIVGRNPILAVESNASIETPITLTKPSNKSRRIKLISEKEFLEMHQKEYAPVTPEIEEVDVTPIVSQEELLKIRGSQVRKTKQIEKTEPVVKEREEPYTTPIVSEEELLKIRGVKRTKDSVIEERPSRISPKVNLDVKTSDLYIAYETDKKTLLTNEAKSSLKEIAEQAKNNGLKIKVVTYASGERSISNRVSLLRANIIKNNLKSYGVDEQQIKVKSFGNQININQAQVLLIN